MIIIGVYDKQQRMNLIYQKMIKISCHTDGTSYLFLHFHYLCLSLNLPIFAFPLFLLIY